MNTQKKPMVKPPKFATDDEEATWWASAAGRAFVKQQSATGSSRQKKGSPLVANLRHSSGVQIALRLPASDVEKAREIAGRKYWLPNPLKMLIHEGLRREARRS